MDLLWCWKWTVNFSWSSVEIITLKVNNVSVNCEKVIQSINEIGKCYDDLQHDKSELGFKSLNDHGIF